MTVEEIVGTDNPAVVRLTHLGQQWLARRAAAGSPPATADDPHPPL